MIKFNVIYDKNADIGSLLDSLNSMGVVIHENFSSLGVLNLSSLNTDFATLPGVLTYEEDIQVTPELSEAWQLLRIGSAQLPMKSRYLPKNNGEGSVVYVMDSGISSHPEIQESSVVNLYSYNGDFSDSIGHGTAVTSLIVGQNIGVAKQAIAKIVKIPSGVAVNISVLLQAFDAILADHVLTPGVKVINCSWVIAKSQVLDLKVQEMQSNNLVVVAAAGNNGNNADNYSPVGLDTVLGVGASDAYDRVVSWAPGSSSNWGAEVDITAPGIDVEVALLDGSLGNSSGTSYAAAIVSGIVLQNITQYSDYTSSQIQDAVIQHAKLDLLFRNESIYSTTPNRLAYGLVDTSLISVETPIVEIEAGSSKVINIFYRSPIQFINTEQVTTGRITYLFPPWCSFNSGDNTLTISPSSSLPAGKYQIMLEGMAEDNVRIEVYGIVVRVYQETPEEIDMEAPEYYYTQNEDNVVVYLQACTGGCYPSYNCAGSIKGVQCGCVGESCGANAT